MLRAPAPVAQQVVRVAHLLEFGGRPVRRILLEFGQIGGSNPLVISIWTYAQHVIWTGSRWQLRVHRVDPFSSKQTALSGPGKISSFPSLRFPRRRSRFILGEGLAHYSIDDPDGVLARSDCFPCLPRQVGSQG